MPRESEASANTRLFKGNSSLQMGHMDQEPLLNLKGASRHPSLCVWTYAVCKKKSLFYLMHNCYMEPHSIAFDLCMLYVSEHEVPDISALQQHQSSSSSTTSHNWTVWWNLHHRVLGYTGLGVEPDSRTSLMVLAPRWLLSYTYSHNQYLFYYSCTI